jgi:TP901 family phage tail tape measure protein
MNEIGDLVVRLVADIREFMGKMDEAEAKVGEFAGVSEKSSARFGKAMSKISTAVVGVGAVLIGYGLKTAYDYGKSIEAIGFQSGATAKEVERLKTHILDLSVATATSATELAAAYTQVEKAGFSGAKADAIVSNSAKLAKLSNTDLITSTKDLIAVQALQANGSKDAAAASGLLLELTKNSVGSMADLNALFTGKPAAAAASYGISLANIATGVEAVTKHGLDASVAMTSLSAGLTRMIKPSQSIETLLGGDPKTHKGGINFSQQQLAADFRKPNGLFVALNDLKTHFLAAGYPAKEFSAFLTQLAGPRGSAGFGIMAKYLGDMTKYYPQLIDGSKKFADSWAAFQKTPEYKFEKLKQEFNKAMVQIGNFVLPVAIDVANAFIAAQKYFDKHPLVAQLATDAALAVFAGALAVKMSGAGIALATAFGAEIAGGTALVIGSAVAAGVLSALAIWNLGKGNVSNKDWTSMQNAYQQNHLTAIPNVAATTGNIFTGAVNKALNLLPGSPQIPKIPIIHGTVTKPTGAMNFPSINAQTMPTSFTPVKGGGTVYVKVKKP